MKVTIDNTTGLMIESQGDHTPDSILMRNAQAAGFTDVSIRIVDDAEHSALIAARDAPPLSSAKASAIAKTYSDVDAIYALTIGNRAEEYKQAEVDARAFKAAGYTGTPTEYVSRWALRAKVTNQQSADAIIARADALIAAKLSLRNNRFDAQDAIEAATTKAEVDAAVATWDAYIVTTKVALA